MPIRFRCSHCQALMQVADGAAGHKTQCPGCRKIVAVPGQSEETSGVGSSEKPAGSGESRQKSTVFSGGGGSPSPQPSPSSSQAPSASVQVRCPHCRQVMRARPGTRVNCPQCQKVLEVGPANSSGTSVGVPGRTASSTPHSVVSGSAPNPVATRPSSSGNFEDFGSLDLGGGGFPSSGGSSAGIPGFPGGAMHQASNPYAAPVNRAPSYSGASMGGSRSWQYMVNGIIFMLAGALCALGFIGAIIQLIIAFAADAPSDAKGAAVLQVVLGFLVTLPISIIYLLGGLALVRQKSLMMARTVAILAVIPFLNLCILFPFGIWSAVLVFSARAQADFR